MIVIIGAGPAGLAASYFATADHLIFEQEAEIGGLCRSFEVGGCIFDLGGHAFFTRHADILALFESKVPGGLFAQPRRAFVHSHGRWLPYPFQANLHGLPSSVIADCLEGLIEAASQPSRRPDSLSDWIDASFGKGIATHFLRPYNEKVWAYPLGRIHAHWVDERIVRSDIRGIIEGALGPRPFRAFPNATVRYPYFGGYANIYQAFAPKPHLLGRGRVMKVDVTSRTVTLENGESVGWSAIISTMPLDVLTKATVGATDQMRRAADTLTWNSLHIASFAVESMPSTDRQRVYCADPALPFHKIVLNSNSSPFLRAKPRFGIQAEIAFSAHKPVSTDRLLETCWSGFETIGLTDSSARIAAADLRTLDRAYPVLMREASGAPKYLTEAFAAHGIFCAGRFGTWSYINSDDAFVHGREAMRRAEAFAAGPSAVNGRAGRGSRPARIDA